MADESGGAITRAEWRSVAVAGLVILALVNLPYLLAYAAPEPWVFSGVLFSLQDGHSYLAKMRQGWDGGWLFTLPFDPEPGPPVFVFTYYHFLGHLARWLNAPLDGVYHMARLLAGGWLLVEAYRAVARWVAAGRQRFIVWLVFLAGSGLGWSAAARAGLTPDFWVAEALPGLTLFSNAHFPLAWALLLWLWGATLPFPVRPALTWPRLGWVALAASGLALVLPMALAPALAVPALLTIVRAVQQRRWAPADGLGLAAVGVGAAPWLITGAWAARLQPILVVAAPSPPLSDAVYWGGLPLLLALLGIGHLARRRGAADVALLAWLSMALLLIYSPVPFQRRLSIGAWLPVCLTAAVGVRDVIWPRLAVRWRPVVLAALGLPTVLSNLLVIGAAVSAVVARRPDLFLTRPEVRAWTALPPGALVLAAPDTAMMIPARTGARVVYGHQYETRSAAERRPLVEAFYRGQGEPADLLERFDITFVYYGPREAALGRPPTLAGWSLVWADGDVAVYGR